jgi:DNA sulfur modification protein DndE
MSWKVFGGQYADIYEALVRARCLREGLEPTDEVLAEQFRLHLHRGIGYLFADKGIQEIEDLFQRVPGLAP